MNGDQAKKSMKRTFRFPSVKAEIWMLATENSISSMHGDNNKEKNCISEIRIYDICNNSTGKLK